MSVVGELLRASMALGARDAEVAELTQTLSARVWVEQAKGALMATEGPGVASERLRARAGASQRTVADVAREVVQDGPAGPDRGGWRAAPAVAVARDPGEHGQPGLLDVGPAGAELILTWSVWLR